MCLVSCALLVGRCLREQVSWPWVASSLSCQYEHTAHCFGPLDGGPPSGSVRSLPALISWVQFRMLSPQEPQEGEHHSLRMVTCSSRREHLPRAAATLQWASVGCQLCLLMPSCILQHCTSCEHVSGAGEAAFRGGHSGAWGSSLLPAAASLVSLESTFLSALTKSGLRWAREGIVVQG